MVSTQRFTRRPFQSFMHLLQCSVHDCHLEKKRRQYAGNNSRHQHVTDHGKSCRATVWQSRNTLILPACGSPSRRIHHVRLCLQI